MSCTCKNYLTSIGKPKNKIDCIAWLLLNVFGCKFCETCRDKSCNIKDGELCTDNIANYIREAVKEENKPTADVVEVVRCRDCKYCKKLDIVDVCEHDKNLMINESNPKRVHVLCVTPDHYCSYGEEK